MEGLKRSEAELVVYLHPSKTKLVSEAIHCELNSLLFKFSEKFDGVLLAYEVDKLMDNKAKILSGLDPYIGARLKANLLLFSPKPNIYLEGKVVKLAEESLHIVILGISACVITGEDIREELKFKIKHGEEVFRSRTHKRHVIGVGTVIRFLVKSFDEDTLHISGSLAPNCTGSVRWLVKNMKDEYLSNRGAEKRKANAGKSDIGGYVDEAAPPSAQSVHKLKRRG
ncbi:hypothetical protein Dimus_011436 [Dionaea muscipula]